MRDLGVGVAAVQLDRGRQPSMSGVHFASLRNNSVCKLESGQGRPNSQLGNARLVLGLRARTESPRPVANITLCEALCYFY